MNVVAHKFVRTSILGPQVYLLENQNQLLGETILNESIKTHNRCQLGIVKVKLTRAREAHTAGADPDFCNMKQLRVLLLSSGCDASPSQGHPLQYVSNTHFYIWVERDNMG